MGTFIRERFRRKQLRNAKPALRELARYFALIALCAFGSTLASQLLIGRESSEAIRWLGKCLMIAISVSAVTTYFLHQSGETWDRYGVDWTAEVAAKAAMGSVGGLLAGCVWIMFVWFQAPFHLERNPSANATHLMFGVIATCAIGIAEEVGYRSYGMEQARRAGGLMAALFVPTSLFVLAHLAGGVPWQAGLLVVGTCSLLYSVIMITTRSLPLVAAFHVGNNLCQDWILRTSGDSFWQVHFQSTGTAEHSAIRIWWGIASVNVVIIVLVIALKKHR